MTIALIILVAVLGALFLLYWFAPGAILRWGRDALRRKGGMVAKSVRVGAIDWPYLEGGDPSGPPLVLVHGFGGDKDNWAFYAPHIPRTYRIVCPDMPGFGENDRSAGVDYSLARQAARLRDFLDALAIDRCHLGGNSMGGAIALQFALDFPDRLRSLTLFNNAGVVGPDESELQRMVMAGEESPLVPRNPKELERLLAFVVHKPRRLPGRFYDAMYADVAPHQPVLDAIFAQLVVDALDNPLNDRLAEVDVPTQIIWGRHDRLLDVSCAKVQHDGIKGSELVIFEDVGHVPMIEKPAETARHHLAFLAKH